MRLNLGCGNDKRKGYINIDIRSVVNPDVVMDIWDVDECYSDVDEILMIDVLEHFSIVESKEILKKMFGILKSGGRIKIQCPDLQVIGKKIIYNPTDTNLIKMLYGGQDYVENFHRSGFTIPLLRNVLEQIGFEIIETKNIGLNLFNRG